MKILLISNMYPSTGHPFYGIFVQNFEKQLTDENIESVKVAIEGRGKSKIDKLKKYIKFFINTYKAVKKNDYDLIYVHYIGHSLLPFLFIKKSLNKPLVINAHGSDIFANSKSALLIQKLVARIVQKSNLMVVPSEYFKDIVENKFQHKNIFISPSGGINTNLFKPLPDIEKQNIFTIGFVSRIDEGKGWDTLLKAIKILKSKKLTFKVMMIGSGEQQETMLQLTNTLDLENCVSCLGAKPHDELPHYFNQMDIFAFTTRLDESLGLVGLESMACGVPVVGSNIGGLPSYISDGVNGKLFEAGNSEELAKCIEFFMMIEKDEFSKYKTQALETAKRYDSKIVNQALMNKLERIVQ